MSLTMPDFLKKESIVPIKKLQDFTFLDRDEFLAEYDVDALAKKAAKDNLPAKSSKTMDANELTFLQELTQAATAATHTLNTSLADIKKGIETIDVVAEKAELDNAVNKIEADLKSEYESKAEELEELKSEVELRQDDVEKFKKENQLKREVVPDASAAVALATILGALVIETVLNGNLLADASSFGPVGGAVMAVTISAINIALGFSLGMFVHPWTTHIGNRQSTLGYIVLILGLILVLIFNLLVGHYREVLIEYPDDSGILAVKYFTEGMFNLTEIDSIFLVVIGLIVSALSFWKGQTQNDSYPGYAQVCRHRKTAKEELDIAKAAALEGLDAIKEECEAGLRRLLKKVSVDYSRCTTLFSTFEQQQRLYESYLGDLAQTGEITVSRYRQVNRSSRDDDAPAYFDAEIIIDFKQKPSIPRVPDIASKLNKVVEDFGARIPAMNVEFSKAVEGYRNKIVAIGL